MDLTPLRDELDIPDMQPLSPYSQPRTNPVEYLVLHATDGPTDSVEAEFLATQAWFQRNPRRVSVDFLVGKDSIARCIPWDHYGYGAGKINNRAIHIEVAYPRVLLERYGGKVEPEQLSHLVTLVAGIMRHGRGKPWWKRYQGNGWLIEHRELPAEATGSGITRDIGPEFQREEFLSRVVALEAGRLEGAADALVKAVKQMARIARPFT